MGQLWEKRKKQDQSQWLRSQQHSFKITQCKATNKPVLLPAGVHVEEQNQSLLLAYMSPPHWAGCIWCICGKVDMHICTLNETKLH